MIRAADEEIRNSALRAIRAVDVIRLGEDLRREAQIAFEAGIARKEEAERLLHGILDAF